MSGPCSRWPAPAKLNLMLHITGRRPDGYHELQTLFQLLDFGDELEITPREDGEIRRVGSDPGVPLEECLAVRAARLLQAESGCRLGCDIRLIKRLPQGGGLGGGSSDAATVLLALNRVWGLSLDRNRLAALGQRLGADVPVFVRGRSAWAEGIGERLRPVELPERWYLVVTPDVSVSTAALFAAADLRRDCPPLTPDSAIRGEGENVFQAPVAARYTPVREALDWLAGHGEPRLTGTGASLFAGFDTRNEAEAALADLPGAWQGFVARGVSRSPVEACLAD